MPFKSLEDVPNSLTSAGLSLAQANDWARFFDEAKVNNAKEPAAIAWTAFKNKYQKVGDKWILKKGRGNSKMSDNKSQVKLNNNKYQEHLSLWTREELESLGFKTVLCTNSVFESEYGKQIIAFRE